MGEQQHSIAQGPDITPPAIAAPILVNVPAVQAGIYCDAYRGSSSGGHLRTMIRVNSGWVSDGIEAKRLKGMFSATLDKSKDGFEILYIEITPTDLEGTPIHCKVLLELTDFNYAPGRRLARGYTAYGLDYNDRCPILIDKDKYVSGVSVGL